MLNLQYLEKIALQAKKKTPPHVHPMTIPTKTAEAIPLYPDRDHTLLNESIRAVQERNRTSSEIVSDIKRKVQAESAARAEKLLPFPGKDTFTHEKRSLRKLNPIEQLASNYNTNLTWQRTYSKSLTERANPPLLFPNTRDKAKAAKRTVAQFLRIR